MGSKYVIEKSFEVQSGHRVYNQVLDDELTGVCGAERRCLRIHGHSGVYIVRLKSNKLIKDMVIDYNELGFIKNALDTYVDHRTMIYSNDPQYDYLIANGYRVASGRDDVKLTRVESLSSGEWVVSTVDTSDLDPTNPITTLLKSYLIISFNSTSENLSQWIYNVVNDKITKFIEDNPQYRDVGLAVDSVSYKETGKSMATYSRE